LYQYGEPCHDSFKDHTSGSKVMEQTRFVTDRQNVQTHLTCISQYKMFTANLKQGNKDGVIFST